MNINTDDLLSIKSYASRENVTPSYIYKLVKEGKMKITLIDGVQFVDTKEFPVIPTKKN
jgi:hypothetical protein